MVKKEAEFYMDKSVTEMELPRMIVCYKEGSYHIIRDICVDEGLHSFDSVLAQNALKDEKVYNESKFDGDNFTNKHISDGVKLSSVNGQPISDVNSEVTEHASLGSAPEDCGDINGQPISDVNNEVTEHASLGSAQEDRGDISHATGEIASSESHENFNEIFFPLQESDKCQSQEQISDIHSENATQRSLASFLEEDRGNTDTAEEIVHASETKELALVQELDRGHCHTDLLSFESCIDQPHWVNSDIDQPKSINKDSEESQSNQVDSHHLKSVSSDCPHLSSMSDSTAQMFSVHDSSNMVQVDEGALEEANSTTSGVSSEEFKEEHKAKDSPGICDSGDNIVAFDINSEPPATTPKKDIKEISEIQQSGVSGLVTSNGMLEDSSTDRPTASSRTSFSHGNADTDFLGPASLSGRIAYSGQVPYSGSTSLRSDSSTTSTRSFAFPILQSEWNNSPVRMAKADRRHFRRHRGWRSGLLCCRF